MNKKSADVVKQNRLLQSLSLPTGSAFALIVLILGLLHVTTTQAMHPSVKELIQQKQPTQPKKNAAAVLMEAVKKQESALVEAEKHLSAGLLEPYERILKFLATGKKLSDRYEQTFKKLADLFGLIDLEQINKLEPDDQQQIYAVLAHDIETYLKNLKQPTITIPAKPKKQDLATILPEAVEKLASALAVARETQLPPEMLEPYKKILKLLADGKELSENDKKWFNKFTSHLKLTGTIEQIKKLDPRDQQKVFAVLATFLKNPPAFERLQSIKNELSKLFIQVMMHDNLTTIAPTLNKIMPMVAETKDILHKLKATEEEELTDNIRFFLQLLQLEYNAFKQKKINDVIYIKEHLPQNFQLYEKILKESKAPQEWKDLIDSIIGGLIAPMLPKIYGIAQSKELPFTIIPY